MPLLPLAQALCGRNFGHNVSACVNLWEGVVPFGGAGFIFSIGFFKQLTAYSNGGGFRAFEVRRRLGADGSRIP